MSFEATRWAWQATAGIPSSHGRLLLLALADMANEHGICWPSLEYLRGKTAQNKRTILKHLADLELRGAIKNEGGQNGRRSNTYRLLMVQKCTTATGAKVHHEPVIEPEIKSSPSCSELANVGERASETEGLKTETTTPNGETIAGKTAPDPQLSETVERVKDAQTEISGRMPTPAHEAELREMMQERADVTIRRVDPLAWGYWRDLVRIRAWPFRVQLVQAKLILDDIDAEASEGREDAGVVAAALRYTLEVGAGDLELPLAFYKKTLKALQKEAGLAYRPAWKETIEGERFEYDRAGAKEWEKSLEALPPDLRRIVEETRGRIRDREGVVQ